MLDRLEGTREIVGPMSQLHRKELETEGAARALDRVRAEAGIGIDDALTRVRTLVMQRATAEVETQFMRRGCVSCHQVKDTRNRNLVERFQVVPLCVDLQGIAIARKFYAQVGIKALPLYIDPSAKAAFEKLRAMDSKVAETVWLRSVEGLTIHEMSRSQNREVWRVRADYDFGLQWMANRLKRYT